MNALELLQSIEARGGVATVKREGRAVKLNVSPRGVALELASDIQRFAPSLLELLDGRAPRVDDTQPALEAFALDLARYESGAGRTTSNRLFVAREVLKLVDEGDGFLRPGRWLSNLWRAAQSIEGRALDSRALVAWARATVAQFDEVTP